MQVSTDHAGLHCLVFRIHSRSCALPLQYVSEIMRPMPLTPLVGTPTFVLGLARIRGQATPVVDGGALFDTTRPSAVSRLVVLRVHAHPIAIAVEAVTGVCALQGDLQDLPPLVHEASPIAIAAIGTLDAELLVVLRGVQLVPDALVEALARVTA